MTTVSLAVALLVMRGLREGFLPGERVALSSAWLLPAAIQWLNANQLPVGSLVLLACFGYLLARMRRGLDDAAHGTLRSEEHTSELQSLMRITYAVFCLKKKKTNIKTSNS